MTRKRERVLVLWADCQSANFGVRVLAEGMAGLARAAWGDGVEVDSQDFGTGESDVAFGTSSIVRDIGRKNGPIKSKLRRYDAILDSGAGDSFTDIYGIKRLLFIAYAHRTASKLDIPVVMGPQTIGPFRSIFGRWVAKKSLRRMNAVIARDPESAGCAQALGRPVDAVSTDVVFALPQPEGCETHDVVLNISGLLWSGNHHVNSARYRAETLDLVLGLRNRGLRVSLLAHVVAPGHLDDDTHAISQFQTEYGEEFEVIMPTTLVQVRSAVASADLVIGARMHACLNALSSGTPTIAWAYSRKFGPLMNDIGWRYVIDLRNSQSSPAAETLGLIASVSSADLEENVSAAQARASKRLSDAVAALRQADPGTHVRKPR